MARTRPLLSLLTVTALGAGALGVAAPAAPAADPAAPSPTGGPAARLQPDDAAYALNSLRRPATRERFYFVMADRFANGDTGNDRGGLTGGRLTTGFDPSDKAFYHGGDLAGLISKLDYIKGTGATAIWLTPSFANKPVQGPPGGESAGYHGYWVTDFTRIDPHLGTNAQMRELIAQAHRKGMKVYFDIITNHTADVIDYREKQYTYRDKASFPYKDASGRAFDDRTYVNRRFPPMDPTTSFPYTPVFRTPADATVKVPAWLNDRTMYHNRGDSTFQGESSLYGDFVGLDDLFTERPEVVKGMGEIYQAWVDLGIDGFRIDTTRHVNMEFWQKFVPDILNRARARGNHDFFAFGEVFDPDPRAMSPYTTTGRLQATLDFGFQARGVDFAKGKPANELAAFFADDDWYTDADSNAYQLPTFLGNHDMGRVAMFLKDVSGDDAELLARVKLANALMFTVRGNPVTYYGDEQGFIGTGGDQLARQDMFATKTPVYAQQPVLAGPSGSRDRFDTSHPLYRWLAQLSAMRAAHPTLADGAQVPRYADGGPGVFAVTRYDRNQKVEYLVVANNSTSPQTASFDTWTPGATFAPVTPGTAAARSDAGGKVSVTVPPLSVQVLRADRRIATGTSAPRVRMVMTPGATVTGRAEIRAEVTTDTFAQTTFVYRRSGETRWHVIGTDDNAPFRVFHDVSGMPAGTQIEYRAIVRDAANRVRANSTWARVGS